MNYITGLSIFIGAVGALAVFAFALAHCWRHRKDPDE